MVGDNGGAPQADTCPWESSPRLAVACGDPITRSCARSARAPGAAQCERRSGSSGTDARASWMRGKVANMVALSTGVRADRTTRTVVCKAWPPW